MKKLLSEILSMDIEGRRGVVEVLSVLSTVWQTSSDIAFDAYGNSFKGFNDRVKANILSLRQYIGIESMSSRGRGGGEAYRIGSVEELRRVRGLVSILKDKEKHEQAGRDKDSVFSNSELVRGDSQASEAGQE